MSRPESYLKTQEVADALGIGVSTLKRWIDAGEIMAARTVGRHRLISMEEALRFARCRDLSTLGLRRIGESGCPGLRSVDEGTRASLVEALKEGRTREAWGLIVSAHAVLGSGAALADEVIGPVLATVGHGWSVGSWDVFQEHRASQIVVSTLGDLISGTNRGGKAMAPIAVGASPGGDLYTIPGLLAELTLREIGWEVTNLGPNLPLASLARAVASIRPGIVFLSACHLIDTIAFVDDYRTLRQAAVQAGSALIVGGRALGTEILARLEFEAHGDRMERLAELGRRLLPRTSTTGPVNNP